MALVLPSWLQKKPLIEIVRVELSPPSLNDNAGDLDRLTRFLDRKGFGPVRIDPRRVGDMARRIRESGFHVTAVLGNASCHWELIDVAPGGAPLRSLAFAVDLGTTRLAFYLIDLLTREVLDEVSVPNPQVPYGEDILTRIVFSRGEQNRLLLQQLLIDTFNRTIRETLKRRGYCSESVHALAVAGNTTMSHFFLGLDAANICREPYIPVANRFPFLEGSHLDLAIHPRGLVYVFPNVGSYFGGDLIAGILAAGMQRSKDVNLLVDVGTNAEVVFGNKDWLVACAGAAGPALEGGVVERGMMASEGAIDRVRIDAGTFEPTWRVLGGVKPKGVCGSGLIDLIAEMFKAGILTIQGKIDVGIPSVRVTATPDGAAYILAHGNETADGKDLMVSDIDIGIFLKSKAAMYTILNVITAKVGLGFKDIANFFVAGTFGNTIDPEMAIRIGMLPDLPQEKYRGLGNTSGAGAAMVLLDRSLLDEIDRVRDLITYVELNVNVELMNQFRGALFLPHTDPRLFPSVEIPARKRKESSEEKP